jgi:hypothetical protein
VIAAAGFNNTKFNILALYQIPVLIRAHRNLAVMCEYVGPDRD